MNTDRIRRRSGFIFMLVLLIISSVSFFYPSSVHADLSCEDPFEGGQAPFNTEFWTETDFCQHAISYSDVVSARESPEGKPVVTEPKFVSVEDAAGWLEAQSPVITVNVNGDARAYPLEILVWQEIANDIVGDVPVAVTYCPLCDSSAVFNRAVDGEVLTLGLTGNLLNSNLVMWDEETQSWWQQFTGEGIVGDFTGSQLEVIPSHIAGFAAFAEQYPDGQVLSRDTGIERDWGTTPYVTYDSSPRPFLFTGEVDSRVAAMERVLGSVIEEQSIAYPFSVLSEELVINDSINETPLVAFWQAGATSVLDGQSINDSKDVGMAGLYARKLTDGEVLTFTVADDVIQDEQTGSVWNVFGVATAGELEGTRLEQMLSVPSLWFTWAAFEPETTVFGIE